MREKRQRRTSWIVGASSVASSESMKTSSTGVMTARAVLLRNDMAPRKIARSSASIVCCDSWISIISASWRFVRTVPMSWPKYASSTRLTGLAAT